MRRAAAFDEMMAAGLAVALAREGLPFRKAHSVVGALVAEAQRDRRTLQEVALRRLERDAPAVAQRIPEIFGVDTAVAAKAAPGGTAPAAVRQALEAARAAVRQSA
jgi:argininosuccinate lyase